MLVEGYVGVVDTGFEVDFGGLEWVFGGEDEEELEFAADVGGVGWAVHYDVPVVDIAFVNEVDLDAWWGRRQHLLELLGDSLLCHGA